MVAIPHTYFGYDSYEYWYYFRADDTARYRMQTWRIASRSLLRLGVHAQYCCQSDQSAGNAQAQCRQSAESFWRRSTRTRRRRARPVRGRGATSAPRRGWLRPEKTCQDIQRIRIVESSLPQSFDFDLVSCCARSTMPLGRFAFTKTGTYLKGNPAAGL